MQISSCSFMALVVFGLLALMVSALLGGPPLVRWLRNRFAQNRLTLIPVLVTLGIGAASVRMTVNHTHVVPCGQTAAQVPPHASSARVLAMLDTCRSR